MRYVKDPVEQDIEIDRSVFIGYLFPLTQADDIKGILRELRSRHPKANHFCHAAITGHEGQYASSSDDGEPARTAGIPILEVLKHHDLTDILCVVVRYFGGIKLGAGGLIRAYTKATSEVLKNARFVIRKTVSAHEISFSYKNIHVFDAYMEEKATVFEKKFLELVTYRFYMVSPDDIFSDLGHLILQRKSLPDRIIDIES